MSVYKMRRSLEMAFPTVGMEKDMVLAMVFPTVIPWLSLPCSLTLGCLLDKRDK